MTTRIAAALVLLGLFLSCSARERGADSPRASPVADGAALVPAAAPRYGLHLLEGTWDTMGLGYDAAQAGPVLQAAWASGTQLLLTERDAESYDWAAQTLTLTPEASQRVQKTFDPDATDSHLTAALDHRAFVVTLDGAFRFGGVILQRESQMGIAYAVMHDAWDGERLVLRFLPSQPVGEASLDELARFAAPFADIRAVFADAGKLVAR